MKWWQEKAWDFNGTKVVEYLWSIDRPLIFNRDVRAVIGVVDREFPAAPSIIFEGESVVIPIFQPKNGTTIKMYLENAINAHIKECNNRPIIAHLIHICGRPNDVAIVVSEGRVSPATNFF